MRRGVSVRASTDNVCVWQHIRGQVVVAPASGSGQCLSNHRNLGHFTSKWIKPNCLSHHTPTFTATSHALHCETILHPASLSHNTTHFTTPHAQSTSQRCSFHGVSQGAPPRGSGFHPTGSGILTQFWCRRRVGLLDYKRFAR